MQKIDKTYMKDFGDLDKFLKYKKMMYKNQANSQCRAIRKAKVDLKVKKMMIL